MTKKYDKSLSRQVYEIDREDGSEVLLVRPKLDTDEGYFTLEVKIKDTEEEIGLGRFLDPKGLPWPKIYTDQDLQNSLELIFGESEDSLTDYDLEVAEWSEALDIHSLRPKQQRDAYNMLREVYDEIIEGTLHDNAVESGDDLYLRFGSMIVKISPRLIPEV